MNPSNIFVFFIITLSCVFLKYIALLGKLESAVVLVFLAIGCFFLIVGNKKEYTIIPILCVDEVSSYYSILTYLYIFLPIFFVSDLVLNKRLINRNLILFFLIFIVIQITKFFIFSDNDSVLFYFIQDLYVFLVAIVAFSYFKFCDFKKIEMALVIIMVAQVLFILIGVYLKLSSLRLYELDMGAGYSSILFMIIAYLSGKLALSLDNRNFFVYGFALSLVIYLSYLSKILSSQNIITIPLVAFIVLLVENRSSKGANLLLLVFVVFLFNVDSIIDYLLSLNISISDFSTKLNNIKSLLEVSGDVYNLTHSVQVRVLEIQNIFFESNLFSLFFGKGFGSHFSDANFPMYFLDLYDYSGDQIAKGVFYSPHNLGYLLLKYGIVLFIVAFIVVFKTSNNYKYIIPLVIFSVLNIGFSLLPSMVLGLCLTSFNRSIFDNYYSIKSGI